MKKKDKRKKTTSGRKQSVSEKDLQYLADKADEAVIAAFANRKPLMQ